MSQDNHLGVLRIKNLCVFTKDSNLVVGSYTTWMRKIHLSKFLFPFKLWQRRLPTYFDRGSRPKHGKTSNLLDEDSAGKDEAAASLFAMTMIYSNNFQTT